LCLVPLKLRELAYAAIGVSWSSASHRYSTNFPGNFTAVIKSFPAAAGGNGTPSRLTSPPKGSQPAGLGKQRGSPGRRVVKLARDKRPNARRSTQVLQDRRDTPPRIRPGRQPGNFTAEMAVGHKCRAPLDYNAFRHFALRKQHYRRIVGPG
jgi:hypothetical protein